MPIIVEPELLLEDCDIAIEPIQDTTGMRIMEPVAFYTYTAGCQKASITICDVSSCH